MAPTAAQKEVARIGRIDGAFDAMLDYVAERGHTVIRGGEDEIVKHLRGQGYRVSRSTSSSERLSVKIDKDEMGMFTKLAQNLGLSHGDAIQVLVGVMAPPENPEKREPSDDDRKYAGGRTIHIMVDADVKEQADRNAEKLPPYIKPHSPNKLAAVTIYNIDLETGKMPEGSDGRLI